MRWIKLGLLILIILFGIYAVSMTFVEERKEYIVQSKVGYPIDKVFPQFNNLQNYQSIVENSKCLIVIIQGQLIIFVQLYIF